MLLQGQGHPTSYSDTATVLECETTEMSTKALGGCLLTPKETTVRPNQTAKNRRYPL